MNQHFFVGKSHVIIKWAHMTYVVNYFKNQVW